MQIIKKEVNIFDRILCVVLAAAVSSAFLFCCFGCPISAFALGEDDVIASYIRTFYDDSKRELDRIEQAIASDINNGNLDASSALYSEYMAVSALQHAMVSSPNVSTLFTLARAYNDGTSEAQKFVDYLNNNSTILVSGSGVSGLYTSGIDNEVHTVTLLNGGSSITSPVVSSDEFSLYFSIENIDSDNGHVDVAFSGTNANYSCIYTTPSTSITYTITFPNSSYFTSGYSSTNSSRWESTLSSNLKLGFITGIPTLPRYLNWSNYVSKSSRLSIGGYGVSVALPEANVDTDTPWDYYNDTLLPYIHNNYPDVPNIYYMFPNGYTPAQDPTEPPLFPFTQPWQNDNFVYQQTETSISVVNPTATNESGTTYTETTILEVPVTETSTSYVPVYGFNVPLLPELQTDTATFPNETVDSNTARNIGNMWSFIKWVLDSSGLFPVFLAFVSIGFVLYILYMLGG